MQSKSRTAGSPRPLARCRHRRRRLAADVRRRGPTVRRALSSIQECFQIRSRLGASFQCLEEPCEGSFVQSAPYLFYFYLSDDIIRPI